MMIKEKIILSNDYSSINKNCFSCKKFNHIIEDCPKLHFVPNRERILKKYLYPLLNERMEFKRNPKKRLSSLGLMLSNALASRKLNYSLKKNNKRSSLKYKDMMSSDSLFSLEDEPDEHNETVERLNNSFEEVFVSKNSSKQMYINIKYLISNLFF